jgi:molybdopterin-biosynthesis enzyme MoeA-like protein
MIKRNRGHEMNDDRKRMAILPEGCKILTTATWVPIAVVKNVYILPGIPSMVRDMLTFNKDHFVGVPIYRAIIRTKKLEGDIAKPLAFLQKQYPLVSLGSYLNLTEEKTGKRDDSYNTKLSIEGRDFYQVEEIAHTLLNITHGYRYFTNEVE